MQEKINAGCGYSRGAWEVDYDDTQPHYHIKTLAGEWRYEIQMVAEEVIFWSDGVVYVFGGIPIYMEIDAHGGGYEI